MNFYFGARVFSYLITVVGAFLITFSIWSVFYSWSSSYHHYLDLRSNFFQVLIADGIKCAQNMEVWTEWADCEFESETTTRMRINAACEGVTDTKPCICPIKPFCKDVIFEAEKAMDVDCMEEFLSSFNDTVNKPFIVVGSGSKRKRRCRLPTT